LIGPEEEMKEKEPKVRGNKMDSRGEKFKVSIKVISDNVCPWCFIGKRRLEQAITLNSDRFEFEVKLPEMR
jgi:hypothetical protein